MREVINDNNTNKDDIKKTAFTTNTDNLKQAYLILTRKYNLTHNAAVGVLANAIQESNGHTNRIQDFGTNDKYLGDISDSVFYDGQGNKQNKGYGLFQWTNEDRKTFLQTVANEMNKPVDSLEVQLETLVREMKGESGYTSHKVDWNDYTNPNSNKSAAYYVKDFHDTFERSADTDMDRRNSNISVLSELVSDLNETDINMSKESNNMIPASKEVESNLIPASRYRRGGKVNSYAPNVIRGGAAIPLGNNFYYMRGRKHEQGGIDLGKNARTGIEVEDGEIMQLNSKGAKVFSAVPFLDGESPAEKILHGDNPSDVFNAQESYKRRNNMKDDGSKKKKFGDWLKTNSNEISLAANALGSGLGFLANANMLRSLKQPKAPTRFTPKSVQASKLKTKVNVNPQLDAVRRSNDDYNRFIRQNTSSSALEQSRRNLGRISSLQNTNEILANKENQETTLINQDRLNQQQVAANNIQAANAAEQQYKQAYDNYRNAVTEFENQILDKKSENIQSLLTGINASFQNYASIMEQRRKDKNTLEFFRRINPDATKAIEKTRFGGNIKHKRVVKK